jgi:hypothetical protein
VVSSTFLFTVLEDLIAIQPAEGGISYLHHCDEQIDNIAAILNWHGTIDPPRLPRSGKWTRERRNTVGGKRQTARWMRLSRRDRSAYYGC